MKRNCILSALVLVGIAVLSSCAGTTTSPTTTIPTTRPSQTTAAPKITTPGGEVLQYGGTFTGVLSTDVNTFDILSDMGADGARNLTNERLVDGDWAKGPAGGYGTSQTLWDGSVQIPSLMAPRLAQQFKWTVNSENQTVTVNITVRQGVHWALNPDSEASLLVNGREVTADDIVWNLNQRFNNTKSMAYQFTQTIHGIHAIKTGPWNITFTIPLQDAFKSLQNVINAGLIIPPEVYTKYGDQSDWHNSEGTGPFMLTDYVSGSEITLKRNPGYWMTDPIGPGKGNQLPYLDHVNWLVIPDTSTQQAAIRTAKIDWISNLNLEDATMLKQQASNLKQGTQQPVPSNVGVLYMRTDKAPFNDVRVRQALEMGIDWQTMNKTLYGGVGQIITFPYWDVKGYDQLYMDLNSPDLTAADQQLFTYHPDQAKQLLAQAGYPNGFNTTLLTSDLTANLDYYSVIKDYWSKIGVNLTLDPMDPTALLRVDASMKYDQMITDGQSPPSTYPAQGQYTNTTWVNLSIIRDPKASQAAQEAQNLWMNGDTTGAFKVTRALLPYLIGQAYAIGPIEAPQYDFWWPWVKNYDGEVCVGYASNLDFPTWIWIDQPLKKSMGH